jgi:hypothetical protein
MIKGVRRIMRFSPYSSWECNAQWQFDRTNQFKLSVPIYMRWDATTVPKISNWQITDSEIIFEGVLIDSAKPQPNKNVDIEYNGKKGWQNSG